LGWLAVASEGVGGLLPECLLVALALLGLTLLEPLALRVSSCDISSLGKSIQEVPRRQVAGPMLA